MLPVVRQGGGVAYLVVLVPSANDGAFVVWGPHGGRVAQCFFDPHPVKGVVCGQVVGLLVPVSFTGR